MAKTKNKGKTQKEKETKTVEDKKVELSNFKQLGEIQKSLNKKQIDFIKKTVAPSLSDNQLYLFLYQAKRLGLDPLNGEIYGYSVYDKQAQSDRLITIVARDGKRVVAERSGNLAGIEVAPIYKSEEGERVDPWKTPNTLWGAEATVYRKDSDKPFSKMVKFSEYNQGNTIWKNKPQTMIEKVAESQALSMAFPQLLGGVYDESEKWDVKGQEVTELKVKGGNNPATEEQKQTIKTLGGEIQEGVTKQEAAELIQDLASKKEK